jgi:hypothetical protein
MNSASTNHWQVNIYDFKIGENPFEIEIDTAILDSGSSLNYIPKTNYENIMSEILKGKNCKKNDSSKMYECDCSGQSDASYPTISLHLGSLFNKHWFQMRN